jgi:hypothetical protein
MKHSIVLLDASDERKHCLKTMSGGSAFCLRGIDCSIRHASEAKEAVKTSTFYVMHNRFSAYCEPSLPSVKVNDATGASWLMASEPLEEWTTLFSGAKRFTAGVSEEDIRAEAQRVADAVAKYRTPKKPKQEKGESLSPFEEVPTALRHFENYAPTLIGKEDMATASEVKVTVANIEHGLVAVGNAMFLTVDEFNTKWTTTIGEVTSAVNGELDGIKSQLGSFPNVSSMFVAPTLGGVIQTMGEALSKINPDELKSREATIFRTIDTKVTDVRTKVDDIEKKTADDKIQAAATDATKMAIINGFIDRLEKLEKKGRRSSGSSHGGAAPPGLYETEAKGSERFTHCNTRIDSAMAEIRLLKNERDSTMVKFGRLGLSTRSEFVTWALTYLTNNAYGCFACPYLILAMASAETVTTSEADMLSMIDKRRKLGLAKAESRAVYSFHQLIPSVLCPNGTEIKATADPSYLPGIEKWNDFAAPNTGIRDKIKERLPGVQQVIEQSIIQRLHHPLAIGIAQEALSKSVAFVVGWLDFMDKTYDTATTVSRFTEVKGLSLATRLTRRVGTELYSARNGVLDTLKSSDLDTPEASGAILFGIFKTHDKMAEFTERNFRDHSSISSEYVKFLASNSGFESVAVLDKRTAGMQAELKEVNTSLKTATKKADTAANVVDELKKKFVILEKKVDKK